MAKVRIMVVDVESGHTVANYIREFDGMNATEAAEDIRDAIDGCTEAEEASDD